MSNYDHNTLVEWLSQNSTNFNVSKLTYDNKLSHDNVREYTSFYTYHGTLELTSVKDFPTHILLVANNYEITDNFDSIEEVNWPLDYLCTNVSAEFIIDSKKIKKFNLVHNTLKSSIHGCIFSLVLNTPNLKEISSSSLKYIEHLHTKHSHVDIKFTNLVFETYHETDCSDVHIMNEIILENIESLNFENLILVETETKSPFIIYLSNYKGADLNKFFKSFSYKFALGVDTQIFQQKELLDKLLSTVRNFELVGIVLSSSEISIGVNLHGYTLEEALKDTTSEIREKLKDFFNITTLK